MTHVGYLVAGYAVTTATLGLYAWWILARGRSLARRLPEEEQRWR